MPRQIRIVCLHKDAVLCFVNNGLADKTSTEPGLVVNDGGHSVNNKPVKRLPLVARLPPAFNIVPHAS